MKKQSHSRKNNFRTRKTGESMTATKAGRPTEYDPARNAMIKQLYVLGATDKEVIKALGVAKSTFYLWKQEHEAFAEAVQEGKDYFDSNKMEESLKSKAAGFYVLEEVTTEEDAEGKVVKKVTKQKRMPPDTVALKYWLNNRQRDRWREQQEAGGCGHMMMRLTDSSGRRMRR